MKKLLFICLLYSGFSFGQSFDFDCSYLFSEKYEGAWHRTEYRNWRPDSGWDEWADYNYNVNNTLLYAFNSEDVYFAYGSPTNVNSCRVKNQQIRDDGWNIVSHTETLTLQIYVNDDPSQGLRWACDWWGEGDTVMRSWSFYDDEGNVERILERKHIKIEDVMVCTDNENEILKKKNEASNLVWDSPHPYYQDLNAEYNRINNSTMYALSETGYQQLVADLNALITDAEAAVLLNMTDVIESITVTGTTDNFGVADGEGLAFNGFMLFDDGTDNFRHFVYLDGDYKGPSGYGLNGPYEYIYNDNNELTHRRATFYTDISYNDYWLNAEVQSVDNVGNVATIELTNPDPLGIFNIDGLPSHISVTTDTASPSIVSFSSIVTCLGLALPAVVLTEEQCVVAQWALDETPTLLESYDLLTKSDLNIFKNHLDTIIQIQNILVAAGLGKTCVTYDYSNCE